MEEKTILRAILIIAFLNLCSSAYASQGNLTLQEMARQCLNSSEKIMEQMLQDNFSVQRINDSLQNAQEVFEAQLILVENGKKGDFQRVLEYCDEIEEIYSLAYKSRDSYTVLMEFYKESIREDMNTTKIDSIIAQIEQEIRDERYENVEPLVEDAYQEIDELRKSFFRMTRFYYDVKEAIKKFLRNNWKKLLIGAVVIIAFLVIFWSTIKKFLIKRRIKFLEKRKRGLKKYLMETQRLYFEKGSISELEYHVRSEEFAKMIRDIDREIPLLKEQLMKLSKNQIKGGKKKKKKNEKEQ